MKTNNKHQGRKKQGHCVQGDYKHFGNQPISPSGVFCLGVYYTRVTYTRTVIYGRVVLNKGRFVLAPAVIHIKGLTCTTEYILTNKCSKEE
jgi:hypothetical protein